MTREEIEILLTPECRQAIEMNIDVDPLKVAMNKRLKHSALVASQVKYLQRAKTKLPSYYAARCILPSLAFEQSSSEATAENRRYSGDLAIDITCGLGVDTFAFSKNFTQVIAIECDPVLAHLAGVNFKLLGADNIKVVNMAAEEFVASCNLKADMLYADPDRRGDDGRKLVLLQDCKPDIPALMPQLKKITDRVVVKLSPLFDVGEAFRIFGNYTRVEVVSSGGECKEIIVEPDGSPLAVVMATMIGFGTVEYPLNETQHEVDPQTPDKFTYLIVPDVAFAKARIAKKYFEELGYYIETDASYAFINRHPDSIPGKAYRITAVEQYSPKKLKQLLKEKGIKHADILKREFPSKTNEIARQLGIREGGKEKIAFTRMAGTLWALFITEA